MKHSLNSSVPAGTIDLWHLFTFRWFFFNVTGQYDKSCDLAENRWSFPLSLSKGPCLLSCRTGTSSIRQSSNIEQGHILPTCMSSMPETSCCLASCGDGPGITVSSTVTSVWAAGLQCWEKSQLSSSSLDRTTEIKAWGKPSAWREFHFRIILYYFSKRQAHN